MNDVIVEPMFARHETFHPRYMWLKKAYDCISDDPKAFRRNDALVLFGVGKNMVNAIKFWSQAMKVMKATKDGMEITGFGRKMFDDDGLDPYLERAETLWILHWKLLSTHCVVPVWWIMLNEMTATVVDIVEAHDAAWKVIENNPAWNTPSPGSVKRDVDVFLHMYTSKQDRLSTEEYMDCPFRSLSLVRYTDKKSIRFTYGPKTGLTPQVVAYACVDFAGHSETADSMSVSRLAVEPGGVGNTFKLSERDVAKYLEKACDGTDSISLTDINGAPHLRFRHDCMEGLLDAVYGRQRMRYGGVP